jgi:hypothetical protein
MKWVYHSNFPSVLAACSLQFAKAGSTATLVASAAGEEQLGRCEAGQRKHNRFHLKLQVKPRSDVP